MSRRDIETPSINFHRDQQFQISTLAEDSSEGSSKKDEGYQNKYFDASDEDKRSKKSIKSLEDISSPETEREDKKIVIIQNNNIEGEKGQKEGDGQERNGRITKFQLKTSDDSQMPNETQLQKRRRKRQQIFRNLRKIDQPKPSGTNQGEAAKQSSKTRSVMNRVAFQKKRENHTTLKHWNYCRIRNLEFHRRVAEELLKNLDRNVKLSLDNLEVYRSFFAQRCRQEEAYANSIFADTDRNLDNDEALDQNIHSHHIYIACSSMLQAVARKDKKQKEIALGLANLIQTKILSEIFGEYFDNVHKQSLSLREKIGQLKLTLEKVDNSICKKLFNLETNFTQCCQDVNKESDKDFYRLELSFLRKCEIEMNLQARYGLMIIDYYHYVVSEEEMRKQLLEKSLKIYGEAFRKYQLDLKQLSKYRPREETSQAQEQPKAISLSPTEEIKAMYSIENMLDGEIMERLAEKIHRHEEKGHTTEESPERRKPGIQFNELNQFLVKCEIEEFNCHHLIMRKFEVEIQKEGKWIPGSVVITVDRFVHIFVNACRNSGGLLYGAQIFHKPEATLKASQLLLLLAKQSDTEMDSEDELEVVLINRKGQSGLDKLRSLIKSAERVEETVRFGKENDLLEFQDYIADLSS